MHAYRAVPKRELTMAETSPYSTLQVLADHFGVCGEVTAVRVSGTGPGLKKAWVEFDDMRQARSAREYDQTVRPLSALSGPRPGGPRSPQTRLCQASGPQWSIACMHPPDQPSHLASNIISTLGSRVSLRLFSLAGRRSRETPVACSWCVMNR